MNEHLWAGDTKNPDLIIYFILGSDVWLILSDKIQGWAEQFIGWLGCNGRIWPNVVYFSTGKKLHGDYRRFCPQNAKKSPQFFLQCLDSHGIETLILILENVLSCRYDLIIGLILLLRQVGFFHVGEQKIDGAKSGVYGRWSTSSKPQSCTAATACNHTCVQEHCPGETGLPSAVFQAVHKLSPVLLFKVLNYLSSVSLSGRKQYSSYHEKLNLMLWHNSFLPYWPA